MDKKIKIQGFIYKALQNLADELENECLKNPNEHTQIYGKEGHLDSLALVSLISDLEAILSEELNIDITLADEKAMSQKNSPFKDVESLSSYIAQLISEQK